MSLFIREASSFSETYKVCLLQCSRFSYLTIYICTGACTPGFEGEFFLFDPQIHTGNGQPGLFWNFGAPALDNFAEQHDCSKYCFKLNLEDFRKPIALPQRPKPRPAKSKRSIGQSVRRSSRQQKLKLSKSLPIFLTYFGSLCHLEYIMDSRNVTVGREASCEV